MIDWRHWHNEPFLVGGLIYLGWAYALLTGPWRDRLAAGAAYPRGRAVCFYAALLLFYFAVGSPLDQIGERLLFSAHMLQHQLLIYPAAVLFLVGLPDWLVRPVTGRAAWRGGLRLLTHPLVCGAIYTLTISVWHAPFLYEWTLQNKLVHVLEHVMFFGAALFYWWPLFSPSREFPPVSYAVQILYLPAVIIGMTPVFAYITFSQDVLYATYEYAPRIVIFGLSVSAAGDQLLAGAMMKLIGMSVAAIAYGVSFYRWYQADQRSTR